MPNINCGIWVIKMIWTVNLIYWIFFVTRVFVKQKAKLNIIGTRFFRFVVRDWEFVVRSKWFAAWVLEKSYWYSIKQNFHKIFKSSLTDDLVHIVLWTFESFVLDNQRFESHVALRNLNCPPYQQFGLLIAEVNNTDVHSNSPVPQKLSDLCNGKDQYAHIAHHTKLLTKSN